MPDASAQWVSYLGQSQDKKAAPVSDERADLMLNMLRAIRGKLDEHDQKFEEIIIRLGRVEREIANLHGDFAGLSVRMDNLDRRVGRIERRLDLVDENADA